VPPWSRAALDETGPTVATLSANPRDLTRP
jgi:hypothetical protein